MANKSGWEYQHGLKSKPTDRPIRSQIFWTIAILAPICWAFFEIAKMIAPH